MFKQIGYRFFTYGFSAIFILFAMFHLAVWEIWTKQILTSKCGDLARIGYQSASFQPRLTEITLPKRHTIASRWQGEKANIVTVGDSFSVGGGGGLNAYYQDYIVSDNNVSVLNININPNIDSYMNDIVGWINSGCLDSLGAKVVIIESIERLALVRFSKKVSWDANVSKDTFVKAMKEGDKVESPDISIVNSGNYKYFIYNILYRFSPNAFAQTNTYKYPLKRKLFASKTPDTLLFFEQDVTSLSLVTPENIKILNDNMNYLADILAQKGIVLVFMVPVDKYDLYGKYIINNPHPENHFFDLLRPLPKKYYFVDTKKILAPLVENNVSDVYHGDDTHWSHKASEAVVRSISFRRLLNQHIKN